MNVMIAKIDEGKAKKYLIIGNRNEVIVIIYCIIERVNDMLVKIDT